MTATDEFRRLLDERGVKWWPMHDVDDGYHQDRDTEFVIDGKKYTAHQWCSTMNVYGLTPEQAIAATLGRGTCHDKNGFDSSFGFECTVCGTMVDKYMVTPLDYGHQEQFRYCPGCGRRVWRKIVEPKTNDVDAEEDAHGIGGTNDGQVTER